MATPRENNPYLQFNFTVDLGDGVSAGFQEVSNIGLEVTVTEYRHGNYGFNNVRKFTGLNKAADVTLKRGVFGTLVLYDWINDIRNGTSTGVRNITIQLRGEDRTTIALEWQLKSARIIKYTAGPLSAKGSDVAMEELVLAYERLEIV